MQSLTPYLPQIVLGLAVFAAIQFLLILGANARIASLNKLLRRLLTGPNGDDLEAMLRRCLEESKTSLARCDTTDEQIERITAKLRGSVQHIGLVRYDAFPDVSGSQSFSLALLDDRSNGAVLTGLLGRNDGRCYGKAIVGGQSEQTLSDEENSALQMALHGGLGDAGPDARRITRKTSRKDKAVNDDA
jgi:hypothetical protein